MYKMIESGDGMRVNSQQSTVNSQQSTVNSQQSTPHNLFLSLSLHRKNIPCVYQKSYKLRKTHFFGVL